MRRILYRLGVAVVIMTVLTLPSPVSADDAGRPLAVDLSSANEVPPSGTTGSGSADVTLNQGQGRVCIDLTAQGLAGTVLAGHIHSGPAGVNGGVVVNLGVNSADFQACIDGVDKDLIKDLRQNPQNYYVNIHTSAVPSGEIRGQLSK